MNNLLLPHRMRLLMLGLGLGLLMTSLAASAQNSANGQPAQSSKYWLARPVYLDIHSVIKNQDVLTRSMVADMAKRALSARDESSILMHDNVLPNKVRVLRVLFIVRKQPKTNGSVIAASAKIDLLRTKADKYNTVLATSIYSGLQQTLIQDTNAATAERRVRVAFEKTLDKRINEAFTDTAAQ